MTEPTYIDQETKDQLAEVLIPYARHSKLAEAAADFFIQEHTNRIPGTDEVAEPRIDTRTLRRFVDFLINKKGYN